jgi:hypothetical protein
MRLFLMPFNSVRQVALIEENDHNLEIHECYFAQELIVKNVTSVQKIVHLKKCSLIIPPYAGFEIKNLDGTYSIKFLEPQEHSSQKWLGHVKDVEGPHYN